MPKFKERLKACTNDREDRKRSDRGDDKTNAIPSSIMKEKMLNTNLLQSMDIHLSEGSPKIDEIVKLVGMIHNGKLEDALRHETQKKETSSQPPPVPSNDELPDDIWNVFSSSNDTLNSSSSSSGVDPTKCPHKHTEETRDGDMVCTECGVCVRTVFNDTPWSNYIDDTTLKRGGKAAFPRWVIERANATSAEDKKSFLIGEQVAHFCTHYSITGEYVEQLQHLAISINEISSCKYVAIAAALFSHMFEKLPDSLEDKMRRGERIQSPEYRKKEVPTFPCPNCQTMCHTLKDARYHCKISIDVVAVVRKEKSNC